MTTSMVVFNRRTKGSFPNETVDRKEGLNIEVNTARPHSVHSFLFLISFCDYSKCQSESCEERREGLASV